MKIAIIGWGYLIWDRRGLDVLPEWQPDGPLLPLEFARFADPPRIVPVLVAGAPPQPTFWTLSRKRSMPAQIRTPFQERVWREFGGVRPAVPARR